MGVSAVLEIIRIVVGENGCLVWFVNWDFNEVTEWIKGVEGA
jgi:hypothetical protein